MFILFYLKLSGIDYKNFKLNYFEFKAEVPEEKIVSHVLQKHFFLYDSFLSLKHIKYVVENSELFKNILNLQLTSAKLCSLILTKWLSLGDVTIKMLVHQPSFSIFLQIW